jgi:hypothetical protein
MEPSALHARILCERRGVCPRGGSMSVQTLRFAILTCAVLVALAVGISRPGPDGARAAGAWVTRALGFLAVEWLAAHAGDPAVFDCYRRLPDARSRGEAFEGAFGLTFEEFYEQFEAYRATLTADE